MKEMYFVSLTVEEMDFLHRLLSKELRIRENSLIEDKKKFPKPIPLLSYDKREKEVNALKKFVEGYELF